MLVDANVILRLLLNDIPLQADKAEEILINNNVSLLHEVLIEIVYVLNSVYSISRKEISTTMINLINNYKIAVEDENVILEALVHYKNTRLDIVDCILLSYNHINKIPVFSFDKKLTTKLVK